MLEPLTSLLAVLGITGIGSMVAAAAGKAGSWALDSVGERAADHVISSLVHEVKDRIAGLRGLPANHDVARAVRQAQLKALRRIVKDEQESDRPEWRLHPHLRPDHFFAGAHTFLDAGLRACEKSPPELDLQVTEAATRLIDQAVTEPSGRQAAGSAGRLRSLAEQAVLDELAKALSGTVIPETFRQRFAGAAEGRLGWFDAFSAYLAEAIKTDARFRDILFASEFASLKALQIDSQSLLVSLNAVADAQLRLLGDIDRSVARLGDKVDVLDEGQHEIKGLLRELLARHGSAGRLAVRIGSGEGLPLEAIDQILDGFNLKRPADGEVVNAILDKAKEFRELRRRVDSLAEAASPEERRLHEELMQALTGGAFEKADGLLSGAIALDRTTGMRSQAAAKVAMRGFLAELRLRYEEAARHFAAAADDIGTADRVQSWRYRALQGEALYKLAREPAAATALEGAKTVFDDILAKSDPDVPAIERAIVESKYAAVLLALGERSGTRRDLEEAHRTLEGAIVRLPVASAAPAHAAAQNVLGLVLLRLGELEGAPARFRSAAAAFRSAIDIFTRPTAPHDWAMAQNNLGWALARLAEHETDTARLAEAAAALELALTVFTREETPREWATTHNNLGNVLRRLGIRQENASQLERAVAAYTAALGVRTADKHPMDWAQTTSNLGLTLISLGTLRRDLEQLKSAVRTLHGAEQVYRAAGASLLWAETVDSAGLAWKEIAALTGVPEYLHNALTAYGAARDMFIKHGATSSAARAAASIAEIGAVLTGLGRAPS
jgi:tetratricopeptide (TPR) repeat protein